VVNPDVVEGVWGWGWGVLFLREGARGGEGLSGDEIVGGVGLKKTRCGGGCLRVVWVGVRRYSGVLEVCGLWIPSV